MERTGQLLDRLVESYRRGADRAELLIQLRALQQVLSGATVSAPPGAIRSSGKVAVILPYAVHDLASAAAVTTKPEEEKIIQVLQVDERELEAELEEIRRTAEIKNELSLKLRQAKVEWDDPFDEIPTLASHRDYLPKPPATPTPPAPPAPQQVESRQPNPETDQPRAEVPPAPVTPKPGGRDLNEVIGQPGSSLNERLRGAQAELSEKLKDAPLRDLRKAIGINDRYLYINDLFNGNEAMFDRSLKTLNAFTAYSEAEFWMQRELRVKLGWKDDHDLVQQFIQLVRRRFS